MSATFDLFLHAAKTRLQVTCRYNGLPREVCPHVIGWGNAGEEMALTYQFGGRSSQGLPPGGDWRCFRLAEVSHATTREGDWHTKHSHKRQEECVKVIKFEVIV